jgi:hypothetical protein
MPFGNNMIKRLLLVLISTAAFSQIDISNNTKGQLPIDRLVHGPASFCTQMDSTGTHVVWASCGSGGSSGYSTIQNAAASITQRTILNFANNIFCSDDVGNTRSNCDLASDISTSVINATSGFKFQGAAGAGKVLIGDGTNFVPGDPFVQGVHADGSTVADNPVVIGGYDTSGTPVLHRGTWINGTPAGTEYGLITRNIPSGTQAVSGTFWQTTQPISVATLPLPSGASTEATLGSRLADSTFTGRIPTNGQKAMTGSLPVVLASDQSSISVTQSGTFTVQPGNTANTTAWKVDGSAVTQPISAASLPLPSGASQDSTLTGGTLKAINRGGAKGSTTAADVTSTASGANHQGLDVALYDASGNQLGLSASPVRTDPTGTTTQPVSIAASVTVAQSTASNLKVDLSGTAANATAIKVDGSAVTQPVSVSTLPLPTGAATSANQPTLLANNGSAAATNRTGTLPCIARTDYAAGTAFTAGRDAAPDCGTDGLLHVGILPAMRPASYHASSIVASAATATDIATLPGNATNTVLVTGIRISCTQTTASIINVSILKRSTANTSGTSTAMTVVPDDSNFSAGSSAPKVWTANPTKGTLVGMVDADKLGCMAPGTAGANDIYISPAWWRQKPIVLRGTAQELEVNIATPIDGTGVTVTGSSFLITFEYIETTTITP